MRVLADGGGKGLKGMALFLCIGVGIGTGNNVVGNGYVDIQGLTSFKYYKRNR